jgi:hypothetical protein
MIQPRCKLGPVQSATAMLSPCPQEREDYSHSCARSVVDFGPDDAWS